MRVRSLLLLSLLVPALAIVDCAASGNDPGVTTPTGDGGAQPPADASPDVATDDAGPDDAGAPSVLTTCDPGGPDRAVVIAVMGASASIQVMTQRGGTLVDRGHTFPLSVIPERLAMRPDGLEAIVAYGGYGKPFGVITISFSHDGATASIGTPVVLSGAFTPWGLDYVSNDRVVLALAGPSHKVVTLDRNGASFAETTRVPAPATWPLKVLRRPGTAQALLARCDLSVDKETTVYLLDQTDGGGYVAQGTTGSVRPYSIDFAAAPNGMLAYSPADSPENPITSQNVDAGGFLTVLEVSDAGVGQKTKANLPRVASLVAADPLGRFLVLPGDVFDTSGSTPEVTGYVLLTMPLNAAGLPQALFPESSSFPAVIPNDLKVSPTGHLIDSLELATLFAPEIKQHPIEIRAQPTPGQWELCQRIDELGASHIAIAP
jgi:hypothetical protein